MLFFLNTLPVRNENERNENKINVIYNKNFFCLDFDSHFAPADNSVLMTSQINQNAKLDLD